jgi:hypothetical protein
MVLITSSSFLFENRRSIMAILLTIFSWVVVLPFIILKVFLKNPALLNWHLIVFFLFFAKPEKMWDNPTSFFSSDEFLFFLIFIFYCFLIFYRNLKNISKTENINLIKKKLASLQGVTIKKAKKGDTDIYLLIDLYISIIFFYFHLILFGENYFEFFQKIWNLF